MVIKKAIRDLYCMTLSRITNTEAYNKLAGEYSTLNQNFDKELSEAQKKQLLILSDLNVDMNEELNRQIFEEGFGLGIRIATEVYYREYIK